MGAAAPRAAQGLVAGGYKAGTRFARLIVEGSVETNGYNLFSHAAYALLILHYHKRCLARKVQSDEEKKTVTEGR